MAQNPFKPTAGKMPPILIGREAIIDDFREGLENGAGAPGRLMLISGNRGYGKTVVMREIIELAKNEGWLVISETASIGLVRRLVDELAEQKKRIQVSINPSIGIPGIASASLGSVSISSPEQGMLTLRQAINAQLETMKPGKGILFAIDEAQDIAMDNMEVLAQTVQLVIGDQDMSPASDAEKKGIAMVFAALPKLIDDLQDSPGTTFIRRAMHEFLEAVPLPDVRDAYIETVTEAGKRISEEVAELAAKESEGHPFMLQLVGYYMWRSAERRGSDVIEVSDVEQGKADSLGPYYESVCAPTYYKLRSPQRLFIEAMAVDAGSTNTADIITRTNRTQAWVSKYRTMLIRDKVIAPDGYGKVRFVDKYLKDYINSEVLYHE